MRNILLLGAGKSSNSLIDYLLNNAQAEGWTVSIGDISKEAAERKIAGRHGGIAIAFNSDNADLLQQTVGAADIVISMLPARFHPLIAKECLQQGKNLLTPSYISKEMKEMAPEVEAKGLLFLNELGLDPGIDHMSAKQVIDRLKGEGHEIIGFESFTGGLVAPESDDNPWHYKFTWNPRNVVLAGQGDGGVKFLHNGKYKYIPYHKLFQRTEFIDIEGYGTFEGYANRDSLKYRQLYGLDKVRTMYRGTFRRPGFCKAWNILVQLGVTDDTFIMEDTENMTHREFINAFLKYRPYDSVELKLCYYLGSDLESNEMDLLRWLGLFDDTPIGLSNVTPAQVLQHILEKKWSMKPHDKDMIVMWHKFNYMVGETEHEIQSSLVVLGQDEHTTAMAQTVGLPIGIAAKMVLDGKIDLKGVHLPIHANIYEPILEELKKHGVNFKETEQEVQLNTW